MHHFHYLYHVVIVKDIIKRSIQRNISSLKNFYKYLFKSGTIESNYFESVQSPKINETLPKALTPEDVEKLLSFEPKTFSDARDKAFLELLYSSGLRVSEAVNVNIASFESDLNFVKVLGKGNKERMLPVGKYAKDAILRWLEIRNENIIMLLLNLSIMTEIFG